MAEKKYTGAGEFGQGVRSALSSAYDYVSGNIKDVPRKTKLLFDEYLSNPLYNKYPQLLLNPTNIPLAAAKAGVEALGGVANVPINLSDNVLTQEEPEPPEPEPTLANRDLLSEYYGGFDNVPVRKAEAVNKKQAAQKLYRVMYAGKGAENSEVYETKEEADAALKKAGGKGAVAGVNVSQKTRGGEMLPVEDVEERKKKYINRMLAPQEKEKKRADLLKRLQSPEYRQEILAKRKASDEAQAERYKNFAADIDTKRDAQATFNEYNKSIGLLKNAYSQAKRAGDFEKAFELSQKIKKNEEDVPREMGARKRYFEKISIDERDARIAQEARIAEREAEKSRRLSASNPDYSTFNNPFNNPIVMRYQ
jgi:hypothetical protein